MAIDLVDVAASVRSWIGHAMNGEAKGLMVLQFGNPVFAKENERK